MNKKLCLVILMPMILSGCVSRSTSREPGLGDLESGQGFDDKDRIKNSELIWFWQGEFWNKGY